MGMSGGILCRQEFVWRFILYPFFIVHNFEAILKETYINKKDYLFFSGETIPLTINISVAIYDNLTLESRGK